MRIAFIGGGKMAEAIIARLKNHQVMVSDIDPRRLSSLKIKYKVRTSLSNKECFDFGRIVVLAVKPQQMAEVLREVASRETSTSSVESSRVTGRKLIISIAAGVPISYLQNKMPGFSIIRAMPNNPCLVGEGITALAKGKKAGRSQMKKAIAVFSGVGEVIEVPEKLMDAVTGLSGSGPAFVYRVIEAFIRGGKTAGLPENTAEKLALQTIAGAVRTLRRSGKSPAELCEMVASPGGTTIEGLKVLQKYKMNAALAGAVIAAAKRSKIISKKFKV